MQILEILLLILMLVLVIVCIVLTVNMEKKVNKLERRYNRFMRGKDMKSMEEVVTRRFADINNLKKSTQVVTESLKGIEEMGKVSFQKIGLVKYDAFDDVGGSLSFALALLTKKNNGFVLNSVHSKEGCYTYLKEIVNGESYVTLGSEEQEALNKAKNSDNFME